MAKRLTTKEFIVRAREVHHNKYVYNDVEYINKDTKIQIICNKHGEFKQTPHAHTYQKQGCPRCRSDFMSKKQKGITKKSIQEHISEFKNIHGDTYNYEFVDFTSVEHKIKIKCKTHGIFKQAGHAHKSGQGCPRCSVRKQYKCNNNVIYLVTGLFNGIRVYKVGITSQRRGNRRLVQLKSEFGLVGFKVLIKKNVENGLNLETKFLSLGSKVHGLKKFGGYTEFRYYSEIELSTILDELSS